VKIGVSGASGHLGNAVVPELLQRPDACSSSRPSIRNLERQEEEPALGASYWRGEQHLIATAPAWTIPRMNFYAEAFVQLAQASLGQGVLTGLAENRAGSSSSRGERA